jgi:hypothetical protein
LLLRQCLACGRDSNFRGLRVAVDEGVSVWL